MDHIKILKRAWEILKRYRVLWVFGLLLALTTASPGSQSSYQFGSNGRNGGQAPQDWDWTWTVPEGSNMQQAIEDFVESLVEDSFGNPRIGFFITVAVVFVLIGIILFIISRIVRYVAETSLIRMVDTYEATDERLSFRQGWKLGRSREAWRLFLLDLAIFFPVAITFVILLALAAIPLLMWVNGNTFAGVIGTVASIGFGFLVIFFIIIASALLGLLIRFFRRVCVLEKTGVKMSIRQGFTMAKQNWKDVGLMWLVTIGINIGWSIVMIPVVLLMLGIGALVGGGIALVIRGITGLMLGNVGAWIVAGVVGFPIFLVVFSAPMLFLGGLKEVYLSSVWTLSYRELQALENLEPESMEALEWPMPDIAELE